MSHLHALQQMYISDCRNIKSLPNEIMQQLHSLKKLDIVGCRHKFNMSSGFQYLTCLETLAIGSCSEVEGFHEALQHMTTLQSLTLSDIPNLEYLPECIGNLTLLHELNIYVSQIGLSSKEHPKPWWSESIEYLWLHYIREAMPEGNRRGLAENSSCSV
jgi:hypothetical protein